jgi:hypothetical protein
LIAQRNAARVFPDPVGERMSVLFPEEMLGQPRICGGLGEPCVFSNHRRTAGWNSSRIFLELIEGQELRMMEARTTYEKGQSKSMRNNLSFPGV